MRLAQLLYLWTSVFAFAAPLSASAQTGALTPAGKAGLWSFQPKLGPDGVPQIVLPERCKQGLTMSRECLEHIGIRPIDATSTTGARSSGCPSTDDIRSVVREELADRSQSPTIAALPAWKRRLIAGENTKPTGDAQKDFDKRDRELQEASRLAPAGAKKRIEEMREFNRGNLKSCTDPSSVVRENYCAAYL